MSSCAQLAQRLNTIITLTQGINTRLSKLEQEMIDIRTRLNNQSRANDIVVQNINQILDRLQTAQNQRKAIAEEQKKVNGVLVEFLS